MTSRPLLTSPDGISFHLIRLFERFRSATTFVGVLEAKDSVISTCKLASPPKVKVWSSSLKPVATGDVPR